MILVLIKFSFSPGEVGRNKKARKEGAVITIAGDLGSITGLGRFPGEGKGCPLQYSWVSPVAQLLKNSPAMWET